MQDLGLQMWVTARVWISFQRRRFVDETGEGVISTAIAVLIMALIGLAMWTLFNRVFTNAGADIEQNVNDIGG
jgi:hypothetical protein